MIRGMECLYYKERLRELGCSDWRRLQGDFVVAFQHIKGPAKKLKSDFLLGCAVIEQGVMALN